MRIMKNPENSGEDILEAIKAYFRQRFDINHNGVPVDVEARKQAMAEYLQVIGNGTWFGGYTSNRVDIFVAGEGESLEPKSNSTMKNIVRRFSSPGIIESQEEGSRQFS